MAADLGRQQIHDNQFTNVNRVLRLLKRQEHSLYNCINSVLEDTAFVQQIAGLYPSFPVFANLRCGLWYIKSPDNTCYFKSTDGHNGNWSFSTTRLNLQVAEAAAKCGGCVIVDATRRGKTFPDALTKTIPIWAAVLNQAVALHRHASGAHHHEPAAPQQSPHTSASHQETTDPVAGCGPEADHVCHSIPIGKLHCEPLASDSGLQLANVAQRGSHADVDSLASSQHMSSACTLLGNNERGDGVEQPAQPAQQAQHAEEGNAQAGKVPLLTPASAQRRADDVGHVCWDTGVHLPLWISANEQHNIELRLAGWVQQLQEVGADLTQLAAQLRKPLQPLWVSQQTRIWLNKVPDPGALDFTPLVLVSASLPHARQRRITGAMADEQGERWAYEYVPGAGDDEESWAKGLTPALLWAHQQELVLAGPRGVEELVQRLVQANRAVGGSRQVPSPGPDEASPRPRESHNLLPAGCAPLAAGTVRCSASGLYWIGDLGIALADCAAGDALQVWDEVDAVLDCGGVEHAGMKSEATTQMKRTLLEAAECPAHTAQLSAGTADRAGTARPAETAAGSPAASPSAPSTINGRQGTSPGAAACRAAHKDPNKGASVFLEGPITLYLWLPIEAAKDSRYSLQAHLPAALHFLSWHVSQQHRVLVHCAEGNDQAVCLVLAFLLACCSLPEVPCQLVFSRPYGSAPHGTHQSNNASLSGLSSGPHGAPRSDDASLSKLSRTAARNQDPEKRAELGNTDHHCGCSSNPASFQSASAAISKADAAHRTEHEPTMPGNGHLASKQPVAMAGCPSKNDVRQHLAILTSFYPPARPTRGMLKQVFNFFQPAHLARDQE